MVLVDSSVWIDYFNGVLSPETNALDALLGQEIVLPAEARRPAGFHVPGGQPGGIDALGYHRYILNRPNHSTRKPRCR